MLETVTRLQGLTKDPDKKRAVGALECRAFLNLILTNYSGSHCRYARAVALDPARASNRMGFAVRFAGCLRGVARRTGVCMRSAAQKQRYGAATICCSPRL